MLKSPAAHIPKLFPPPFTELFDVFDALPGRIGGVEAPAFWRSLTLTLWDTGQPLDTIARLRWWNVDLTEGSVTMARLTNDLQLSPLTVAALREIEEPQRIQVFPWVGGTVALHQALNSLIAKAAVLAERDGDR